MRAIRTCGVLVAGLAVVGAGIGAVPVAAAPAPVTTANTAAATTIAPGIEHSQYDDGVVEADILKVDLAEPTVKVVYTSPEMVADRAVMTSQATRAGAIAAVNGDNFDKDVTNAPRGVGVVDGKLRHGRISGWNNGVAFTKDGDGTFGRPARIVLDATVTPPSGSALKPTNLNSTDVATNGIGIYTPEWGTAARSHTINDATDVREVELREGKVSAVRTAPGSAPPPADGLVLLGREDGSKALAGLKVGDAVDVTYKPTYDAGDPAVTAITGRLELLRDGVVTTEPDVRHPRTGVGLSKDGKTMWLVALDGRSTASQGMSYIEFGNFLKSLGADDALNLDGGGSTTMVAKLPGKDKLSVLNKPSDEGGAQRPVGNGIGIVSTSALSR